LINAQTNINHQSSTYDELSKEFKELYPSVYRALQLIPLMYNRLTLVDNFSHKEALKKIYNDHKELSGFSERNIYRALPKDNPAIPKRVVPKRHKSSDTIAEKTNSLSVTEQGEAAELKESNNRPCPNCQLFRMRIEELEEALKASAGPTTAAKFAPQIQRFTIFKERHIELTDSMEKSIEFIYLEFDKKGTLVSVIADSHYKKFHGRDEK
jgi:hypothetical protein